MPIEFLEATANSATYDQWTASAGNKWDCVAKGSGGGSYVNAPAATVIRQYFTHSAPTGTVGLINAFDLKGWMKEVVAGGTTEIGIYDGGVTEHSHASATAWQWKISDISGDRGWSDALVRSHEFGCRNNAKSWERYCELWEEIDYTVAGGGMVRFGWQWLLPLIGAGLLYGSNLSAYTDEIWKHMNRLAFGQRHKRRIVLPSKYVQEERELLLRYLGARPRFCFALVGGEKRNGTTYIDRQRC